MRNYWKRENYVILIFTAIKMPLSSVKVMDVDKPKCLILSTGRCFRHWITWRGQVCVCVCCLSGVEMVLVELLAKGNAGMLNGVATSNRYRTRRKMSWTTLQASLPRRKKQQTHETERREGKTGGEKDLERRRMKNERKRQSWSHHQTNTRAGLPFLTDSNGKEEEKIRGHRETGN